MFTWYFLTNHVDVLYYIVLWLILNYSFLLWQMRDRRCAVHLLTCKAVVSARLASSYGRYVTRLWARGTTFSLLSSALSSLLLARCRPGWWASLWCFMSATSRRKTDRWTWTRMKPVRQVVPRGPGVTMATETWKRHILFKRFNPSLPITDSTVPPVTFQTVCEVWMSQFDRLSSEREKTGFSSKMRNFILLICSVLSGDVTLHSGCHCGGFPPLGFTDHVCKCMTLLYGL